MYQVKDVMVDQIVSVRPETSIDEAVELLLKNRVSGLPVTDEQGQLLGVISEIDIINLVYEADLEKCVVADYMTQSIRTLDPEDTLDEAAEVFCSRAIRRFPVTKNGKLVGVIARHDLIRFVRNMRKATCS